MSAIIWENYRKCPACSALLGQPCKSLDGVVVGGQVVEIQLNDFDRPHGGRQLRAESRRG